MKSYSQQYFPQNSTLYTCTMIVSLYLFLVIHVLPLQAQSKALDSLKRNVRQLEARQQNDTMLVRAFNELAYEALDFEIDSVPSYCQRSRTLAESLGDKRGLAQMLNNLGLWYRIKSKYDSAFATLTQALRISDAEHFHDEQMMALSFLCLVQFDTKDFPKAVETARKMLAANAAKSNDSWTNTAYNNLGAAYRKMEQFDSALFYLNKTYQIRLKNGNKRALAGTLINIASVFESQGKLDSSISKLEEALEINKESQEASTMLYIYKGLARVYLGKGEYSRALASVQRSLAIADSVGFVPEKSTILALLADIHEARGDFQSSLAAQKASSKLKDSLNRKEIAENIATISAQYESEKKEQQIRLLTADKVLQTTIRQGLIALGIALFLAIAALASRYRLKSRSEEALQHTNAEILRQQELLAHQASEIELANAVLSEKNMSLETQQEILEEQAREIEIANTALQEKNIQLEYLNTEKNEFLGIAAHDLKNPLAHILMLVGKTTRYYDRLTDNDIKQELSHIGGAAARMTEIISNLLDVNALERGGLQVQLQTLDIVPITNTVVEQYRERASEKNIRLLFESGTQARASADSNVLTQVLDNLISNAVKYSPHGKNVFVRVGSYSSLDIGHSSLVIGHSSLVIGHSSSSNSSPMTNAPMTNAPMTNDQSTNGFIRIEFQDEGPGISPEDMTKLFGKFARLSARPTGGEHSTGLGLSIVKKMVEAMNGRVWCESELGNGATFIVELPIAAKPDSAAKTA
jgi:signal transduction histidine kinase